MGSIGSMASAGSMGSVGSVGSTNSTSSARGNGICINNNNNSSSSSSSSSSNGSNCVAAPSISVALAMGTPVTAVLNAVSTPTATGISGTSSATITPTATSILPTSAAAAIGGGELQADMLVTVVTEGTNFRIAGFPTGRLTEETKHELIKDWDYITNSVKMKVLLVDRVDGLDYVTATLCQ